MDCENLFSIEYHEIHLRIEWDLFIHDIEFKILSYEVKFFFLFYFFSSWLNFHHLCMSLAVQPILTSLRV